MKGQETINLFQKATQLGVRERDQSLPVNDAALFQLVGTLSQLRV